MGRNNRSVEDVVMGFPVKRGAPQLLKARFQLAGINEASAGKVEKDCLSALQGVVRGYVVEISEAVEPDCMSEILAVLVDGSSFYSLREHEKCVVYWFVSMAQRRGIERSVEKVSSLVWGLLPENERHCDVVDFLKLEPLRIFNVMTVTGELLEPMLECGFHMGWKKRACVG